MNLLLNIGKKNLKKMTKLSRPLQKYYQIFAPFVEISPVYLTEEEFNSLKKENYCIFETEEKANDFLNNNN